MSVNIRIDFVVFQLYRIVCHISTRFIIYNFFVFDQLFYFSNSLYQISKLLFEFLSRVFFIFRVVSLNFILRAKRSFCLPFPSSIPFSFLNSSVLRFFLLLFSYFHSFITLLSPFFSTLLLIILSHLLSSFFHSSFLPLFLPPFLLHIAMHHLSLLYNFAYLPPSLSPPSPSLHLIHTLSLTPHTKNDSYILVESEECS